MTAVGADVAVSVPIEFRAVTPTRRLAPTSGCLVAYVRAVAPDIDEQLFPLRSQRRHWYLYVMGAVPDHVPGLAVSVSPMTGEPAIVGRLVLRGLAEPWTFAVGFEAALVEPSEFVAVTRTRIRRPTSASRTR